MNTIQINLINAKTSEKTNLVYDSTECENLFSWVANNYPHVGNAIDRAPHITEGGKLVVWINGYAHSYRDIIRDTNKIQHIPRFSYLEFIFG